MQTLQTGNVFHIVMWSNVQSLAPGTVHIMVNGKAQNTINMQVVVQLSSSR